MKRDIVPLLSLAAGFTVWTIAFAVLYSALSVGCRLGWDEVQIPVGISLQRAQLAALTAVSIIGAWALVQRLSQRKDGRTLSFLQTIAYRSAIGALASSVAVFAAVFFLIPC